LGRPTISAHLAHSTPPRLGPTGVRPTAGSALFPSRSLLDFDTTHGRRLQTPASPGQSGPLQHRRGGVSVRLDVIYNLLRLDLISLAILARPQLRELGASPAGFGCLDQLWHHRLLVWLTTNFSSNYHLPRAPLLLPPVASWPSSWRGLVRRCRGTLMPPLPPPPRRRCYYYCELTTHSPLALCSI
jgi:hypothetical protein